jgi:hypothetical protein
MDDREWMYMGHPSQGALTAEWIEKMEEFIERAFALVSEAIATWCPCSRCAKGVDNQRMSSLLIFARIDSQQIIPGGSTTVKPIGWERRS